MMNEKSSNISDTLVETNEIVLPSHTNALGTIFGGVLMSWIDMLAAICAQRHTKKVVVTASVDALHFLNPVRLGDVVTLRARVIYTGKTSLVIRVDAHTENLRSGTRHHCVTADLSFVALDSNSKPTSVPAVHPKSDREKNEFQEAAARRKVLLEQLKTLKSDRKT